MYKIMSFAVAVTVALVANSAVAGGPNGPRGSAAAVTVCELNPTSPTHNRPAFDVDILVSDMSSGVESPTGVSYMVDLMGKDSPGRWEKQELLAMKSGGAFVVPTTIMAAFNLCAEDLTGIRALNALVELTYDDGNGNMVTIQNRCGDDPGTSEVEPDGIPLDQATRDEIDAICND
jgi:hypothetical protein